MRSDNLRPLTAKHRQEMRDIAFQIAIALYGNDQPKSADVIELREFSRKPAA